MLTAPQELERLLEADETLRAELGRLRTERDRLVADLRAAAGRAADTAASAALQARVTALEDECDSLRASQAAHAMRSRDASAGAEREAALLRQTVQDVRARRCVCDNGLTRARQMEGERDRLRADTTGLRAQLSAQAAQMQAAQAQAADVRTALPHEV
jgi:hypothetical protein